MLGASLYIISKINFVLIALGILLYYDPETRVKIVVFILDFFFVLYYRLRTLFLFPIGLPYEIFSKETKSIAIKAQAESNISNKAEFTALSIAAKENNYIIHGNQRMLLICLFYWATVGYLFYAYREVFQKIGHESTQGQENDSNFFFAFPYIVVIAIALFDAWILNEKSILDQEGRTFWQKIFRLIIAFCSFTIMVMHLSTVYFSAELKRNDPSRIRNQFIETQSEHLKQIAQNAIELGAELEAARICYGISKEGFKSKEKKLTEVSFDGDEIDKYTIKYQDKNGHKNLYTITPKYKIQHSCTATLNEPPCHGDDKNCPNARTNSEARTLRQSEFNDAKKQFEEQSNIFKNDPILQYGSSGYYDYAIRVVRVLTEKIFPNTTNLEKQQKYSPEDNNSFVGLSGRIIAWIILLAPIIILTLFELSSIFFFKHEHLKIVGKYKNRVEELTFRNIQSDATLADNFLNNLKDITRNFNLIQHIKEIMESTIASNARNINGWKGFLLTFSWVCVTIYFGDVAIKSLYSSVLDLFSRPNQQ